MMVDEGIYNSLIQEQKQWQQTSMALDQSRLKIYGLEQDMTKLRDEKDKLQQAHRVALEAGGAVLQQMSLQAEGLRKEVTVLIAEKTQLTTQLQAKTQETYHLDTELKHMTKQAVNTENALGRTAAEVEQLKKEKQQLQQLLQDTQQAAAMTNHQTKQEAALAEARLNEELQSERLLRLTAEAQIAQVRAEATALRTALLHAEWSIKASDATSYKLDQEMMSMRAQKQSLEQQMYEIQARNKILTTENNALDQGVETATLEVARGNQRISLMEDREKQLSTLLKQHHEEHQSHVASLQLKIMEHERTIAKQNAVALTAEADKNQIHSRMTQMSDFLQLSHQQLKTVQQQQKTQQQSLQAMSMYASMPATSMYATMPASRH